MMGQDFFKALIEAIIKEDISEILRIYTLASKYLIERERIYDSARAKYYEDNPELSELDNDYRFIRENPSYAHDYYLIKYYKQVLKACELVIEAFKLKQTTTTTEVRE